MVILVTIPSPAYESMPSEVYGAPPTNHTLCRNRRLDAPRPPPQPGRTGKPLPHEPALSATQEHRLAPTAAPGSPPYSAARNSRLMATTGHPAPHNLRGNGKPPLSQSFERSSTNKYGNIGVTTRTEHSSFSGPF